MPNLTGEGLIASLEGQGFYFGYGMFTEPQVFEAVTGQEPVVAVRPLACVALNAQLAVQGADRIPTAPTDDFPDGPKRDVVDSWAHAGHPFESYTMRELNGVNTAGTLYLDVTVDALRRMKAWEIVDDWRVLAFPGVQVNFDEPIAGHDSMVLPTVMTTVTRAEQGVDRVVADSMSYDPFLMGRAATFQAIRQFAEAVS